MNPIDIEIKITLEKPKWESHNPNTKAQALY